MKKLLLLIFLFLGFIGSVHSNVITDIFLFPKLEKFNKCVEDLKKQDIGNRHKLCADKYAKEITNGSVKRDNGSGNPNGNFSFETDNTSSEYTIKAIGLTGYFQCKDVSKCKRQSFAVKRYTTISPGTKERISFSDEEVDIELPEDIKKGEWGWGISTDEYLGFKISY